MFCLIGPTEIAFGNPYFSSARPIGEPIGEWLVWLIPGSFDENVLVGSYVVVTLLSKEHNSRIWFLIYPVTISSGPFLMPFDILPN